VEQARAGPFRFETPHELALPARKSGRLKGEAPLQGIRERKG